MERLPENPSEETENDVSDESGERKVQSKYRLTIEVPLFLAFLAISLSGAPTSNLIMYRACVHSLGYSVEECRSFLTPGKANHTQELEDEVQKYTTFVGTVKGVLESVVPAIMSVFVGVWSDKHGRKPLLTWSLMGMFMSSVLTVIYSMVQSLGPWWYVSTVIPFSLGGGFVVMITGSVCYVNDTSTKETRSVRLLYLQLAINVSTAVGSYICPVLLNAVGNIMYLLLLVASLLAAAYSFTAVYLEESLKTSTPGTILTVMNINHVKEMMSVCLRKKPNYGRAISMLLIIASALSVFTTYGISGLSYLYSRNKIHWTMQDFTTYSAIGTAMWFAGAIIGIGVLQRLFHISDVTLTLVSFMSVITEYFIKAFATKTWHMYLGSAISLFGTVSGPLLRSIQSKVLPSADVAKVFALMASAEAICPLLAPVAYNTLYAFTISSFPGAFFLLSSGINIICFILLTIVMYLRWKTTNTTYQVINSEAEI